jgi:hypothetical protein
MPLEQMISFYSSMKIAVHSHKKAVLLSGAKNPRILLRTAKTVLERGTALTVFLSITPTLALSGCHSAYVNATVSNHTPAPVSLVQVEYPSASFGTQTIAPGADFHYRFKVLGSGPMKITYTDTTQHEQKSTGPTLHEGTEGQLAITVASDGVHWQSPPASH